MTMFADSHWESLLRREAAVEPSAARANGNTPLPDSHALVDISRILVAVCREERRMSMRLISPACLVVGQSLVTDGRRSQMSQARAGSRPTAVETSY